MYSKNDMTNKIDSVTARSKLKGKREPYWQRISKGFFVGFRNMSGSSDGTWCLRFRIESGKQVRGTLGTLDEFAPYERFDKAVLAARDWLTQLTSSSSVSPHLPATVWQACQAYVKHVEERKGKKPADDLAARYRRWVETDPIHGIDLADLSREQVNGFRRRMVAHRVKVNKSGETRERSKDSVNRDMAAVRAALNHAFADGLVTTNFAWREPLKAFKNAGKRRTLYLDREQRRSLIEYAPEDLARFLRGLSSQRGDEGCRSPSANLRLYIAA
jgi:hypothetical protein